MKWGRGGYLTKPKKRYHWLFGVVVFCIGTFGLVFLNTEWSDPEATKITSLDQTDVKIAKKKQPERILNKIPVNERESFLPSNCNQIIGRVFDDQNGNGNHDPGETGLPSISMSTVNGLLFVTDNFGRYHVPCNIIDGLGSGSNFVLKLDTKTLPKDPKNKFCYNFITNCTY